MKIINLVSAHTGNDLINHGFTYIDGIIGVVLFIVLVFIINLLIVKRRKTKK